MRKQLIKFLEKLNFDEKGKLLNVDVSLYVDKIIKNAAIFSIFKNTHLKAFIAYYDNDPLKDLAFLTMIAVDEDSRKRGLGKSLLEISIKEIEGQGFRRYGLEVKKNNIKAMELYSKYGFEYLETREDGFIYMEKTF
jgi:ribosomal-protein-alanine N-acetyltransferase